MESKIFLIYEGVYEDCEAIGFSCSEKDAVQICLNHNKNTENQNAHWNYCEANAINTPTNTIPFVFAYCFHLEKTLQNKKYILASEYVDFYEEGEHDFTREPQIKKSEFNDNITIKIPTKEKNREAAIEKAQNLLNGYNGENFIIR